jgi:hypothetical protein
VSARVVRRLADPANREVRRREPLIPGKPVDVYYFHYAGHIIWGVTARIIVKFLEIAGPRIAADALRPT